MDRTFAVAIGGAAGQGVATPGDIFAKLFARRGLHINAYNVGVPLVLLFERGFHRIGLTTLDLKCAGAQSFKAADDADVTSVHPVVRNIRGSGFRLLNAPLINERIRYAGNLPNNGCFIETDGHRF